MSGRDIKTLVVIDDPAYRATLCGAVEGAGLTPDVAGSLDSADAFMSGRRYDLIIADTNDRQGSPLGPAVVSRGRDAYGQSAKVVALGGTRLDVGEWGSGDAKTYDHFYTKAQFRSGEKLKDLLDN